MAFVYFRWSWSWTCYFGLGLKNLILFTSLPDPLDGGACCPFPVPQEIQGPWRLLPRFSALRAIHSAASSYSLHFPQCIRVLIKTPVVPNFGAKKMHHNARFCIKIYKKNPGVATRTPAAEGETFVCTHPRAHLPDAGAPPLLLGWLRPCTYVLKVKVHTLDIASLRIGSKPQKRSGMTRVLKGFHSFTHTPTRSSVIGMSHTCPVVLEAI